METLFKTDFVLYDNKKQDVVRFSNGDIVLYGDIQEALYDQKAGAIAMACTDLPAHLIDELINQVTNI
jgi:precorrin-4 methylase